MPSNFLEFNQGLQQIDKGKDPDEKIQEIVNYIKQMTQQLRYEFRHIRIPTEEKGGVLQEVTQMLEKEREEILQEIQQEIFPLSADEITEGILPATRGGTGAETAAGARENLGLGGLGTVTELTPGTVSLASGAWKEIGSVELTKGTWLITAQVAFDSNATGRRAIYIGKSIPTGLNRPTEGSQGPASASGSTVLQAMRLIQTTEDSTTLKIAAGQNSGSAISLPEIRIRTVQLCAG